MTGSPEPVETVEWGESEHPELFAKLADDEEVERLFRLGRERDGLTREGHRKREFRSTKLDIRLGNNSSELGAPVDLEEPFHIGGETIMSTPEDYPDYAGHLENLRHLCRDGCLRPGSTADLDEAIHILRELTEATPDNSPQRPARLSGLGILLADKYSRMGGMDYIDDSIEFGVEAERKTPMGDSNRIMRWNNLRVRLTLRYARTGKSSDLTDAIELGRYILDATPEGHPDYAENLDAFVTTLRSSYLVTKEIGDLTEAIGLQVQAVGSMPEGHLAQARCLSNLGLLLYDKYARTDMMSDLEQAIMFGQEAVDLMSEDDPNTANYLTRLGNELYDKYSRTKIIIDLQEAISNYKSGLHQISSPTITRILAGRKALHCCSIVPDWQQAYDAANTIMHLIPELTSRLLSNEDKQHILSQITGLASDAAAAALHADKGPSVALKFLEVGRGVLEASIEESRIEIRDLEEKYPELAERFLQYRNGALRGGKLNDPYHMYQPRESRMYEASAALDKLFVEIRKLPGFEDFLLVPSEEKMRTAAKNGAIVVVNVSDYRCDAILVEQHRIRSLALPNLSSQEIKDKAEQGDLGSLSVLRWLWDVATHPIIDAMGYIQPLSEDNRPRIWWIPTGALSKFPLHATGNHIRDSSESVLDMVLSSYSLSIKAIINTQQRRNPPDDRSWALLVAIERTPGSPSLPFATKEVTMLEALCRQMGIKPIKPGPPPQEVGQLLLQCKFFHFADHGHTDSDPSKSHFVLEKGQPLSIGTLLGMNLRARPPFLAYLSACGTGRLKDERLLDENIHLISACQLAGFRHVIGTLWEVNDELCVDMARITYEGMIDGGMTDDSVCWGLHKAIRELRDRWLDRSTETEVGSRSMEKRDKLARDGLGSSSGGDQRRDGLPRDVIHTGP
jgi:tetratricopeptide (TPR) repeat protein